MNKFEFAQADSSFARLTMSDSTSAMGPYGLALNLERRLCYLDALSAYSAINERDSGYAPAIGGEARCYYELGSYSDAAQAALDWVRLATKEYQSHYWLALSLINLREFDKALASLQLADESGLSREASDIIRAKIMWLRRDFDGAAALASKSRGGKSQEFFAALCDYFDVRGMADSAVASARQGWEMLKDEETLVRYIRTCLNHRYFYQARQALSALEKLDREKLLTALLRSEYMWASLNRFEGGIYADQVLELCVERYQCWWYAGMARHRMSDEATCAQYWERILEEASTPGRPTAFALWSWGNSPRIPRLPSRRRSSRTIRRWVRAAVAAPAPSRCAGLSSSATA